MTDWAVAAHRGVSGSSGTGTVGCGLAGPLDGPVPGNAGMPSASAWCVPVGVCRLRACAPLSKRPGSPSLVLVFPPSRRRITTGYTCDKHSAHLSSIATQHVDNSGFLRMHRAWPALSQVKAPSHVRPGSGIPSISTAHAQAQCRCAQVIHMFMHSQQVGLLAVLAGSSGSACWCLRDTASTPDARLQGLCPDEIVQERGPRMLAAAVGVGAATPTLTASGRRVAA